MPPTALAQLALLAESLVERGDVFWVPGTVVIYRGKDKDRPCLVAAVDAARAHMVPGTSQTASGPAIVVNPGEVKVSKRTEFDFSASFPLTLHDLAACGTPAGRLAIERLAEIDAAIRNSNQVALKRLIGS